RQGQPRPDPDDDGSREGPGVVPQPVDGRLQEAQLDQGPVEEPDGGMVDHPPDQPLDHRRHGPRDQDEHPGQALKGEPRVEEEGQPQAQDDLTGGDGDGPDGPRLEGRPELVVRQHVLVVVQAGELRLPGPQAVVGEAQGHALEQGDHRKEKNGQDRWNEEPKGWSGAGFPVHQPCLPTFGSWCGGPTRSTRSRLVDSRTMSRGRTVTRCHSPCARPSIRSRRSSPAILPRSAARRVTVDKVGVAMRQRSMSSMPMTATSWGTRMPRSRSRRSTPMAMASLAAKTPSR